MHETLFVFLFFVGIGVAFWLAMEAVRRRTVVWYALSGLLPCLYSLVGFFILGLINGRGVDVPAAAFFGMLSLALGWMIALHDGGEQHRNKQAELAQVEERVINDQSYIDEWQDIVTRMERDGNNANEARAFLEGLRQSKADYLARRDRILMELEQDGVRS
jgi:hypothetical protein